MFGRVGVVVCLLVFTLVTASLAQNSSFFPSSAPSTSGTTTPGGSNTQVQFNTNSSFGGISSVTSDGASIFALTSTIGSLTATTIRAIGWLTASGANHQTATIVGNITAGSGQFTGQVTGTSAVFQTMTINNLTPTGPNCIQETGGVLQATNGSCSSGGVSGGAPGAVALWSSSTVLTNDIGITFISTGQLALNLGTYTATANKALNVTANWSATNTEYDAPLFMNVTTTGVVALGSKLVDVQFNTKSFLTIGVTSGAPTLALSYTTSPTGMVIYNTVDDPQNPTNSESGFINWTASSNVLTIGNQKSGSGVTRHVEIQAGSNLFLSTGLHGSGSNIYFNNTSAGSNSGSSLVVGGTSTNDIRAANNMRYEWSSGGDASSTGADTAFARRAAGAAVLQNQGNLTTGAGWWVYNTVDVSSGSPTNYEAGLFDWTTSVNTLTIGSGQGGTGSGRVVMLVASGTKAISLSPTINLYGQSNPGANETYAVCAGSGATSLTAGGQLFVDTTACLASSMLVKHDIAAFNDYGMTKLASLATPLHAERRLQSAPVDIDPIAEAMALVPAVATYDTLSSNGPEFTLIAQQVCEVDERLCERTRDGEVRSFKPNSVISILVAAMQKQQAEIEELKRRLH